METKQMYVADLNIVFGKEEKPLVSRIDDIVLPALNNLMPIQPTERVNYIFQDVQLNEIEKDEYIIQGILIKDTILEVMSEYSVERGLEKTNKSFKSSPYSVFMIYLKNHRMMLIKNQPGSPDIRSFGAAIKRAMNTFVSLKNKELKKLGVDLLPRPITNIAGIKTAQSIRETLKNVDRIKELTFKFYPLNEEWDYDSVFADIDERIRKTTGSKNGKMILSSPKSIEGVAELIEATDGLVQTKMEVFYNSDLSASGTKKKATIKDNEISEAMNVDLKNDLDDAYKEIHATGKNIKGLNVQSKNNLIAYEEFLGRRKK